MNYDRAKNLLLTITVMALLLIGFGTLTYSFLKELATIKPNVEKILSH